MHETLVGESETRRAGGGYMGAFVERKGTGKNGRGGKRLTLGIGAAEKKRKREEKEVEVGGISPFKGTGYAETAEMTYAM